ncbi:MAG: prepilin-type N-terminal cleavage/methylation domain-containing protein, partial [Candidatus Saccharicenans sp.]|nr:prepilin-type N-terminal cleavage/methylation domain-containing protein [Candidatus Saccharicenans sp.]
MISKSSDKRRGGFSLLETTVVLSIAALLVLVGSSFRLNSKKHLLEVAVRKVHSSLSLARF